MTMKIKTEIWRPILNYEGYYEVSSFGRVRSVDRIVQNGKWTKPVRGRILKLNNNDGYMYCCLCKDGKTKQHKVHRLVAQAFIPNPDNLPYINHKNEDKGDNRVENLEWCTKWYNEHYGNFSQKISSIKREKARNIVQYDLYGNFVRKYSCLTEVEEYGFSGDVAGDCCRGKTITHNGFVFRFEGEPFSIRKYKNNIEVQKIDKNGTVVAIYASIKDAERKNGYGSYALRKHHLEGKAEVEKDDFKYVFLQHTPSGLPIPICNNT